jgi:asparagine synthase (glutamine-hydrolysing)
MVSSAVASIDGPTEYSLYPSNVSAKLGPKDPQEAAENIHNTVVSCKLLDVRNFLGVVIIDANDLGQKILGNTTKLQNSLTEKIFKDNPMGQSDEQTPLTAVFKL